MPNMIIKIITVVVLISLIWLLVTSSDNKL